MIKKRYCKVCDLQNDRLNHLLTEKFTENISKQEIKENNNFNSYIKTNQNKFQKRPKK